MSQELCAFCGKEKKSRHKKQWWDLQNYYRLTGLACADCWEKVRHNPEGKPLRPKAYQRVLTSQKSKVVFDELVNPIEPPSRKISLLKRAGSK